MLFTTHACSIFVLQIYYLCFVKFNIQQKCHIYRQYTFKAHFYSRMGRFLTFLHFHQKATRDLLYPLSKCGKLQTIYLGWLMKKQSVENVVQLSLEEILVYFLWNLFKSWSWFVIISGQCTMGNKTIKHLFKKCNLCFFMKLA
jgi:hypothetical protein